MRISALLRLCFVAVACTFFAGLTLAAQQAPTAQPAAATPSQPPETGIAVTNQTVIKTCGGCHRPDDKGQLSRISFQRNTPEGWQETIKRMMALNGLKMDPAAGREIVKYLSDNLGLAPDEAKPAAFEAERQVVYDQESFNHEDIKGVCNACHSLGRVISQRRTRSEWELLIAMHRGWYPLIDRQVYRRMGPVPRDRGPDGRPPDTRHPSEKAVDYLSKTYPFQTAAWESWAATKRSPRLDGSWALTGYEVGKGPVYGRVQVTAVPNAPDEFTTETTFTYARTGEQVKRTGRTVVYTGYQWRGRSATGASDQSPYREVMFVDRDWRGMDGRWFTGGYDEIGMDVELRRVGNEMTVLGVDRSGLKKGGSGQTVKIYAMNAPAAVQASDLDLGAGVTVSGASVANNVITATVSVADAAALGPRDVVIAGSVKPGAVVVYDKVDHIRVGPEWNMARVGGVNYPKMLASFDAWGYMNGPDKKPNTPDDIKIDIVDVTWSMEEYTATLDDDDVKFVGAIDAKTGKFTPNNEGPNENRSGERNNIGDVWVVGTYNGEGAPIRGRAHLLVAPPVYMRFDASVISR
jgi:quinohemoprotein amine dehydrogenase